MQYYTNTTKNVSTGSGCAKTSSGFTIIETLVALSIFSFALVGLVSVSAKSITDATGARSNLVANYLAQEGIETMRSVRDSNLIANAGTTGWNMFQSAIGPACASTGCDIDPTSVATGSLVITPCPNKSGCTVFTDPSTGAYTTDQGSSLGLQQTVFTRRVTVVPSATNAGEELRVVSTVTWQQGLALRSVVVTENLFDWQF